MRHNSGRPYIFANQNFTKAYIFNHFIIVLFTNIFLHKLHASSDVLCDSSCPSIFYFYVISCWGVTQKILNSFAINTFCWNDLRVGNNSSDSRKRYVGVVSTLCCWGGPRLNYVAFYNGCGFLEAQHPLAKRSGEIPVEFYISTQMNLNLILSCAHR